MPVSVKQIKEGIGLNELNLFSAASLASIEYNCSEKRDASKRTEILEWLVESSKEQARQLCERARARLRSIIEACRHAGYRSFSSDGELIEARLVSRGFSGSRTFCYTLFEVGLEFDPYLNLPIIPGSSIKGALRSAWRALELGSEEKLVFGEKRDGEGSIGGCIFFDALPIEPSPDGFILYPDVITPHYWDDIMDETRAEPNPITYITVAPGVKFGFVIAVDKALPPDIFEKLTQALLFAFKIGLGAKTSIGYGVFTITNLNIKLNRR